MYSRCALFYPVSQAPQSLTGWSVDLREAKASQCTRRGCPIRMKQGKRASSLSTLLEDSLVAFGLRIHGRWLDVAFQHDVPGLQTQCSWRLDEKPYLLTPQNFTPDARCVGFLPAKQSLPVGWPLGSLILLPSTRFGIARHRLRTQP